MAKFINMYHDDIPNRITLVDKRAFEVVWKDKGWKLYEAPSLSTPETLGEPRSHKSGTKNPAKKKLTSPKQDKKTV